MAVPYNNGVTFDAGMDFNIYTQFVLSYFLQFVFSLERWILLSWRLHLYWYTYFYTCYNKKIIIYLESTHNIVKMLPKLGHLEYDAINRLFSYFVEEISV